jgi:Leishmanolysin
MLALGWVMPRSTDQPHGSPTLFTAALILICALPLLGCGADRSVGPPLGSTGQIEVRYASQISPLLDAAVKAAAVRWSRALSKNLGDFQLTSPAGECFVGQPALNESHHNLLLFVTELEVDGTGGALAFTNVCRLSSRDTLPILAQVRIDRADVDAMVAEGTLQGVVLHEMGHALGFTPDTYTAKGLSDGGSADPILRGASAVAQFTQHGAWYTGAVVPLENTTAIGPRDPHWRISVFGDELMVAGIGRGFKSPLSSITLGYFHDIGYDVDYSVADQYEVVPFFGGTRVLPQANLRGDVVVVFQPTFVTPLRTLP